MADKVRANPRKLVEELFLQLKECGYQGRIVSIEHLHDLQEEIEGRFKEGLFDKEFYQERLAWFNFRPPDSLPEAKSMIIVAVPSPQNRVVFTWKGEKRGLILPPTYVAYDKTTKHVERLLAGILEAGGYHVARTALPLKLLAVRSGLGEYGRNNVCYVSGMGSFLQLVGVYSDLPCLEDSWREVRMMERCQHCQACRQSCPTDAISSDRFLLRAERCLVFHNEKKGDVPFASWIDPSWHNCLYGCLHCQRVCPEDKEFLPWIGETEEFSEEETALLLEGVAIDRLPATTVKKLERLELNELRENFQSLCRNLGVFFKK